jgi:hypothetical protein
MRKVKGANDWVLMPGKYWTRDSATDKARHLENTTAGSDCVVLKVMEEEQC